PATITRFAGRRACRTDASDSGAASPAAAPAAARRSTSRRFGSGRSGVRGEVPSLIVWPPEAIVSDGPVASTGRRPGAAAGDRTYSPRQPGVLPRKRASSGPGPDPRTNDRTASRTNVEGRGIAVDSLAPVRPG